MAATTQQSGPTLTHFTHYGRLAVKYGLIGLVALMVGRAFFSAVIQFWKATHPTPPPPPTVGFGKLPPIAFEKQTSSDKPKSYSLEFATKDLPDFGDRAKVFLMPKAAPSLLADEEVKKVAATYDFIFEPEVLDSRTYRWTKSQPIEMNIKIDIQNMNFSLGSDYLSRPGLLSNNTLPENFEAVTRVKTFLSAADLLSRDIATSSGKVSYLKSLGGELSEAFSLSDADFVQVDLDRIPINGKYEMVSPDGKRGVVSAIITGALSGNSSIVSMEYHHKKIDYSQVETYPLRTAASAWKILQAGEGYIVNKGENNTAVIRRVDLSYYDDWAEQSFLQPVYVFRGDDDFMAYVPALDPQFIQQK